MLASFIAWHLRIGFRRIYLYFDDPCDAGIAKAQQLRQDAKWRGYGNDAVRVIPCDERVKSDWAALETSRNWDLEKVASVHVEVRQMLNAEHGLRQAHEDGDIDWLLHIDADELFHIEGLDAAAHFGRLSAHGCVGFKYPIHEGTPETPDAPNVFESVTLFRTHEALLEESVLGGGDPRTDPTAAERAALARDCVRFWSDGGRQYHLGSPQGKSATRVLPGVRPMSVHTWWPPEPSLLPKCWAGFREMRGDSVAESVRVVSPIGSPCILHYISCSFSFWWHKYRLLGRFPNHKPGGAAVGGLIDASHFHAQSRDLVWREATREDGRGTEAARRVYEATVCLLDAEEAERQTLSGVCRRIQTVRVAVLEAASEGWSGLLAAPPPVSIAC